MVSRPDRRPLALVTGASLGIGLALAQRLAQEGMDLVLVARTAAKLEALARELKAKHPGLEAHVVAADLGAPGAAAALEAELARRGLAVDVLVNNAGYGLYGEFTTLDDADATGMLQLNMIALTELTRRLARAMQKRGTGGRILNVASTAAFQPGPLMAEYYATKAYVLSLSEALANELERDGITVTALCPGPVHTGFQARSGMAGSRLLSLAAATPEHVADAGVRGLVAGRAVVIPGLLNWILAESVRVTPRAMVRRLSRLFAERKRSAA
jgi:short-subunit dehydrogenase